jgi:hypothetical protein
MTKALDRELRNTLESKVTQARDVAERGAKAILEHYGVFAAKPPRDLTEEERAMRLRLRAHGRAVGDARSSDETQSSEYLIEETAYEHWHRMLFSRYLSENGLLMYQADGAAVPVTLSECHELADSGKVPGAADGWEVAGAFASRMLPQIFRVESPVFLVRFSPEYRLRLERLVEELPVEVFTASDSLGWVYQFWQAKKKDEVNASGVKIGARELPAVTQLFTEPYMVGFLLDNSLGAWWAERRLSDADLQNAGSEEDLRRKAAIPGVPLDYLRFVQQEGGSWTPAAGTFDGWPEQLADLKTLDPCCGSGHFLVAAFLMLVPMRMERDGLSAKDAVDAVLRENIYGLELDQRCVELAAFALALTAWKYPTAGGYRVLPELNVACSGLSISAKKEEWLALAGDSTNLRLALEELYKQFKDAPVLGSLINPEASLGKGSLFELKWEEVGPLLTKALSGQKNDEENELGVVAYGLSRAATILASKYQWIITNVPYLTRGKQSDGLMSFIEKHYYDARKDLAAVMSTRAMKLLDNGAVCAVVPQNLFQLTGYTEFRKKLLSSSSLGVFARLGAHAFETISGENVSVALLTIESKTPDKNHQLKAFELSNVNSANEKAEYIQIVEPLHLPQAQQAANPDARIIVSDSGAQNELLSSYADGVHGLGTKDAPIFMRNFWEFSCRDIDWEFLQASIYSVGDWCGMESVIHWQQGQGELHERAKIGKAILAGGMAHNKGGVLVSPVGGMRCGIYHGGLFDKSTAVISPTEADTVKSIYCYTSSDAFESEIKLLDSKVAVTNKTLVKVPFDRDHWTKVAEEKYPNGLPKPYTDDPTQWIFHGHPCGSVVWDEKQKWTAHGPLRTDDSVLHIAVARLLGYRWPAELDASMELADEQREWVGRCEALAGFPDDDGIVCIPPVRGEASASDRLLNLLAAAYGDAWSNDTLAALLKSADHAGKTLETWLREKFFTQHCKLFQHRPFIWHIWDGLRDGFAALVNYHKLDAKLLETLIYTYLGDWISRQKQDINSGVDGAQERLAATEALKKKLELILEGEAPYDIFVRWKTLAEQPIGWNPDLNDGVRLNIRPFLTVPDVGKKGAGVLRDKPNIKWDKDRGKDVESAPWYHLGLEYGGNPGDRINDHHLSLAEKRKALL